MRLVHLATRGWRNLVAAELAFAQDIRVQVFFGANGQGKTNVLEAINYLATFRSFRTSHTADLIQTGTSEAEVVARVVHEDTTRELALRLASKQRRIAIDGKPARGLASAAGLLSTVLFVPEDLALPRAAPAARRRFVDLAVWAVERAYWDEMATFQRVLKSRNALLRRGGASPTLLATYDEQLAPAAARVVMRRRAIAADLAPLVAANFRKLHADLHVELRYRSEAAVEAAVSEKDVAGVLAASLRARRQDDERRRHTTVGPQTDDLEIDLDGRPARAHASQGQLRSLVLALKFAEVANIERRRREIPLLLLDDVPSELDPTRRRYLFESLAQMSCQTFISVADPGVVPRLPGRADFEVIAGRVTPA